MAKTIRFGGSQNSHFESALSEMKFQLMPAEQDFTILFVSDSYEREKIGNSIKSQFGPKTVACTTAGEIGVGGYSCNSITGLVLSATDFVSDLITIEDLNYPLDENLANMRGQVSLIIQGHRQQVPGSESFAIILTDGLSAKEEYLMGQMSYVLNDIPIVGGSAGDGLKFKETGIYSDGTFKSMKAVVVIVSTCRPFYIFKSQHFSESDKKMVITESDPSNRIVKEIDGEPAALAYAKLLGLDVSELTPSVFSKNPVLINIGSENYIRSIQKVNPDNSLTFYCAIEDGIVLTLAKRDSFLTNLKKLCADIYSNIGEPSVCLGFECILRRLEVLDMEETERLVINDVLKSNSFVGFHTYGEQLNGVHINQTLTGVAIGG